MSEIIKKLILISQLVEPEPTTMFVTSLNWALMAKEMNSQYREDMVDKSKLATPSNFQVLKIGALTVVNSGTEDQEVVDEANQQAALKAKFAYKRDNWRTG